MNPIVTIESLRNQLDILERDAYLVDDELVLTTRENGSSIITLGIVRPDGGIAETGVHFAGLTEI